MNERVRTVLFMIVITAVATAVMTGAQVLLRPTIVLNEEARLMRGRLQGLDLLPEGADAAAVARIYKEQVELIEIEGRELFLGYDKDGTLKSVGMTFRGPAFWGPVSGVLSLDPDLKQIAGLAFLQQQETPGLGGRIMEPWFTDQFKGKQAEKPDESGRYLQFLPEGVAATQPNQVDGISGATRTTDSVNRIVNNELKEFHAVADKIPHHRQNKGRSTDTQGGGK